MNRVNGELAMSRALGDYQYKRNKMLEKDQQMVSCYPDIAVHIRSDVDQLLVVACDGVWDVMSNVESINFLQDIVLSEDRDMSSEAMAEALIDLSFGSGSTDNISAIVVKLTKSKAVEDIEDDDSQSIKKTKKSSTSSKKRKLT